jgi:hypothetical protein
MRLSPAIRGSGVARIVVPDAVVRWGCRSGMRSRAYAPLPVIYWLAMTLSSSVLMASL